MIVNVATGRYLKGQMRLLAALPVSEQTLFFTGVLPPGCPDHEDKPYAFKAYALKEASKVCDRIMWLDAAVLPVKPLEPIWEQAAEYGVWMSNNGWSNAEWTADSAYPDLFAGILGDTIRSINAGIKHVVGGAIAIDLTHPNGLKFLYEYYRLASRTRAFCGPWVNGPVGVHPRQAPCGPPTTRGHRHDQTAASVLAWRYGIPLTDPPRFLSYRGGETEETILIVDGDY